MEILIDSNPPFYIKTYDQYFEISEKPNRKDPSYYYYKDLINVLTKPGKLNWFVTIGNFFIGLISLRSEIRPEKNYDELILIFKNGTTEIKYLQTGSIHKIGYLVNYIQSRIK